MKAVQFLRCHRYHNGRNRVSQFKTKKGVLSMEVIHKETQAKAAAEILSQLDNPKNFNRAKVWQMGFFAANNTATNAFMF